MKNFFNIIFKKDPPLNYIITEQVPLEIYAPHINSSEYEFEAIPEMDEMQIDNIYRSL